jgi:NitT/TauT family transport system ATP-binding protein
MMDGTAGLAAPDARTVLLANRVEKTYGNGVRALDEVRLRIQQGEFVSLLGPSGCGKSTLLRMFAGLEEPSAGHIAWWNQASMPGRAPGRSFSMVFQEANLLPWTDVLGNVRLPLDLAGVKKTTGAARAAEALETVGLGKFHKAYPAELSGGMRMRAAIARALVTEPNLLLMDEPFGALDEFTRNRLDSELRDLWTRRDLTVVFVTHSIYEAVFLSSRIVVMGARPGRIIAEVVIDGPKHRDEAFRVSPSFIETCQRLSGLLAQAHDHDPEGAPE